MDTRKPITESPNSKKSHPNLTKSNDDKGHNPNTKLPPAAQRALQEAEQRREEINNKSKQSQKEINGRGGLDPVRYKDWEVKGIAIDF